VASYRVTLIPGDGIGPEVTDASVRVLEATGIKFEWDIQEAGEKVIEKEGTPLPQHVLDSLKRNRVGLKGPLTTPIGGGFRSVNVALRQMLDLYASVRPARSIAGEGTLFSDIDLVVVREATEELYSGVEHWVDREHSAAESISIVTRKASERIVRYAFEYAVKEGRKKVTAVHKANILKTTGALFQEVSQRIARDFPQIGFEERLIDNMAMQLVKKPHDYDVIVTTNLFGDILSDLCSGLAGGLGIAPGAIIGDDIALFEPVHGSAPKYAGLDRVNPVATILSGEMMLRYLGEREAAERIWNAVYDTVKEKKVVTYDLALPGYTRKPVAPSTCSQMAEEIARKVRENS
jgi:isocitrate dehydrogenase (NAD+)